jgi:predicted Zn-dependent protease with MMP-like domain
MPFSRWFGGGQGGLRDRLMTALQQARDGDMVRATETISERFAEALQQLEALPPTADAARLRLAAWLAYRSGDMHAGMDYARRALAVGEDAWTWNLVGRAGVWLSERDAETAFRKAASLDPGEFVVPYRVRRDRFHAFAEKALAAIPKQFQALLSNTLIVVDDLPALEDVRQGEDPDLLGLYEGATVLEHGLPERIVLYQRNHENIARDARELEEQVIETMRHEIGHHFGMGEDDLPY